MAAASVASTAAEASKIPSTPSDRKPSSPSTTPRSRLPQPKSLLVSSSSTGALVDDGPSSKQSATVSRTSTLPSIRSLRHRFTRGGSSSSLSGLHSASSPTYLSSTISLPLSVSKAGPTPPPASRTLLVSSDSAGPGGDTASVAERSVPNKEAPRKLQKPVPTSGQVSSASSPSQTASSGSRKIGSILPTVTSPAVLSKSKPLPNVQHGAGISEVPAKVLITVVESERPAQSDASIEETSIRNQSASGPSNSRSAGTSTVSEEDACSIVQTRSPDSSHVRLLPPSPPSATRHRILGQRAPSPSLPLPPIPTADETPDTTSAAPDRGDASATAAENTAPLSSLPLQTRQSTTDEIATTSSSEGLVPTPWRATSPSPLRREDSYQFPYAQLHPPRAESAPLFDDRLAGTIAADMAGSGIEEESAANLDVLSTPDGTGANRVDPPSDMDLARHQREETDSTLVDQDAREGMSALLSVRKSATSPLSTLIARLSQPVPNNHFKEDEGTMGSPQPTHRTITLSAQPNGVPSDLSWQQSQSNSPLPGNSDDRPSGLQVLHQGFSTGTDAEHIASDLRLTALKSFIDTSEAMSVASIDSDGHPRLGLGDSSTNLGNARDSTVKVSPSTARRWSMQEVEAAYDRMRQILASRRPSAAASQTPSLVMTDGSQGREATPSAATVGSGLQRVEPDDGIPLSSQRPSDELLSQSFGDEAANFVAPLPGGLPCAAALRQGPSRQNVHSRPESSSTNNQSHSPAVRSFYASSASSNGRHQSDSSSTPNPASPLTPLSPYTQLAEKTSAATMTRNMSEGSEHPKARPQPASRRFSAEASVTTSHAGSDDTGWMTPRTSMHLDSSVQRPLSASGDLSSLARRRQSGGTETTDRAHHLRSHARRPLSYSSSSTSVESHRNFSARAGTNTARHLFNGGSAVNRSTSWYDDTPRATRLRRPGQEAEHSQRAPLYSAHGDHRESSTVSLSTLATSVTADSASTWIEAKQLDKIELFLRCSKAEAALQTLTAQSAIEREALLDALQESRLAIEQLRQQREELLDEADSLRHIASRRGGHTAETARQIAEIVEARDSWQARAQAAERELQAVRQRSAHREEEAKETILELRRQLSVTKAEAALPSSRRPSVSIKGGSAANNGGLGISGSHRNGTNAVTPPRVPKSNASGSRSSLPRSTGTAGGSPSSRSRLSSSASGAGRVLKSSKSNLGSTKGSTNSTNFGDHVRAESDGWSVSGSHETSLRLDEDTARHLLDI